MTNNLILLAHWSVRQKLNHVSSVEFSYVALCVPLYSFNKMNVKMQSCAVTNRHRHAAYPNKHW